MVIEPEGLDSELLRQLERELPDESEPGSAFEARRQAERAGNKLSDFLNSQGYFRAEIDTAVEDGPPIVPRLRIRPGPRFAIGAVGVTYSDRLPDLETGGLIDANLPLTVGQTGIPEDVLAGDRSLVKRLKDNGYAFASSDAPIVLGDAEKAEIDVTYKLDPGARIKFGEIQYENEVRTRKRFTQRLVPFKKGEIYSPDQLGELNKRLAQTRLYTISSARLADNAVASDVDGDTHDVVLRLEERPRNTIEIGGAYSTSEGVGGVVDYSRRNLTRRGDTLRVTTTLAQQEQSVAGEWTLPHLFGYGKTVTSNVLIGRENTDAFERATLLVSAAYNHTRNENQAFIIGLASETVRETDNAGTRTLQTVSAAGTAQFDYSDDLLDPTTGWRGRVRVEPGTVFGDEQLTFISTLIEASHYWKFGKKEDRGVVWANRTRLGSVAGADTLSLPTSRRFFAGGGGSVRGFGFQDIGPRDLDNLPTGGRGLFEVSSEVRWRFSKNLGVVGFVEGASVTDDPFPNVEDFRVGVGAGVRYYTAIGPIRFDIATPVNPQPGDNSVQIYISIGQAF